MLINQVNRVLYKRHFLPLLARYVHQDSKTDSILHPLISRRLLKVSGDDVAGFLQGLMTNDMRHFEEGANSMYTMFLNNKGKVMYDTLIHKYEEDYLIECDNNVLSSIQKHLKIFKLRRQIAIDDMNNELKLWALTQPKNVEISSKNVILYKDPRISDLGYRVIASSDLAGSDLGKILSDKTLVRDNDEDYKYLRYSLGVSEGVLDVPPGACFPLEANCDYLHGVSFHKGCYIGQELTARVHHTGVVRKRLMPLKFSESIQGSIEQDARISASGNPKSNLGKLRGFCKDYGLGLIRIKEAVEADVLSVGDYSAKVVKPPWWPIEAPKEKPNVMGD